MEKQVYFFDFDNTIVDSLDLWYDVMDNKTFVDFGLQPSNDFAKFRQGKSNMEIAQIFVELNHLNIDPKEVIKRWNFHMKENYIKNIQLISGAKEFLLKLKDEGKRLAILSATDEDVLRVALKHFDIDIFENIFTEENINLPKHNPKFYQVCLEKFGVKNDDVVLYEDSFVALKSATSIGIECVALKNKYNQKNL